LCSCHIVITYPESLQGCALARRGAHRRRCTVPRPYVAHEWYYSRVPMRTQIGSDSVQYNHINRWIIQARETKTQRGNGRCLTCRLVLKNKSSRRSNRVTKVTHDQTPYVGCEVSRIRLNGLWSRSTEGMTRVEPP
jgi:hypothetical protein